MELGLIASLAFCATVPGAAMAQVTKGTATITTTNTYKDRSIWITIYDLAKTRHLDYGCVDANAYRYWKSGNYLYGSFYYVRAEVKAAAQCGGATLCDTTIQVNPQTPGPVTPGGVGYSIHTGDRVWLVPNGNNCYWATSAPSGAVDPPNIHSTSPPAPLSASPVKPDIAKAVSAAICQQFSDGYAIVAGKGFGFAPADVRTTWKQHNCNTSPADSRKMPLCQELSNRFGMVANKTFGSADAEAQGSWKAMGCTTSPKK
jgi:hypothetical protein